MYGWPPRSGLLALWAHLLFGLYKRVVVPRPNVLSPVYSGSWWELPSDSFQWVKVGKNVLTNVLKCLLLPKTPGTGLLWIWTFWCHAGFLSAITLSSESGATPSSLTWCPVCASRTTHLPVRILFSICCPFSWWKSRMFSFPKKEKVPTLLKVM